MRKLTLLGLIFTLLLGGVLPAAAQDDDRAYCGDLSAEDCLRLTDFENSMFFAGNAQIAFVIDVTTTDAAGDTSVNRIGGGGTLFADIPQLVTYLRFTPDVMRGILADFLLRPDFDTAGILFDWAFDWELTVDIDAEGGTVVEIPVRGVGGTAFVNASRLLGLEGEQWIGLPFISFYEVRGIEAWLGSGPSESVVNAFAASFFDSLVDTAYWEQHFAVATTPADGTVTYTSTYDYSALVAADAFQGALAMARLETAFDRFLVDVLTNPTAFVVTSSMVLSDDGVYESSEMVLDISYRDGSIAQIRVAVEIDDYGMNLSVTEPEGAVTISGLRLEPFLE